MKTKTVRYVFADLPRDYNSLVAVFPPRTIHDEVDLANTMELIDALAGHKLSDDQDDYLETLAELVNAYDKANNPLADEDLTPVEVLEFLLEQHSMNASDLESYWKTAPWDQKFCAASGKSVRLTPGFWPVGSRLVPGRFCKHLPLFA